MSKSQFVIDEGLPKSSTEKKEDADFKRKAAFFLAGVAGMSAIFGFGSTVAYTKRQDPKYFNKGMVGALEMSETGASLAMRALGWGTLYAVAGSGLIFYSIWKLSGANTMEEFRYKMGSILPKIPKNDPPKGRTEFSGMNDLLEYLSNPTDQ